MEDKKKELDDGLKLLAKSAVIVFISFSLAKIFGYLYRVIIARYFGPEVYGLFTLATVIVGFLVTLALLGFDGGVLRFISFYRGKNEVNKMRYLFKTSFWILLSFSLIISIISFFLSGYISESIFHNDDLTPFLKIYSLIIPFWVLSLFSISVMRAFEKIKEVSIIDSVIQSAIKVILLVILIFFGFKLNSVIFSFIIGILITFSLAYSYCKIMLPQLFFPYRLSKKSKKLIFSKFVKYSLPVLFLTILSGVLYWVDSFMIGLFKSASEVGLYNAAIPIVLLLNIAPEIFLRLFLPMVTKEYSLQNMDFIKKISKQIGKWVLILNLPVFLIMIVFPDIILNILFGPDYITAAPSLRILSIGALFYSIFVISDNLLSMAGKSKIIFYDVVAAGILNSILNFILIRQPVIFGLDNSLGINGAAIATTISFSFYSMLFWIQARHYTSISPLKKEMIRVFLAALTPLLVILFFKGFLQITNFVFAMLSGIFVLLYLILLFLFRAFDENDMFIIKTFKKKINSYNYFNR
ncbi:flippase [Candidatus Pacearchaeota archaeon]|nr:flippase [Candidatus Pacearchaeota archaeon]